MIFFQVTKDKFIEELEIQADKSPNATITAKLKQLFVEWCEDDTDPESSSAEVVHPDQASSASPSTTSITEEAPLPSSSVTPSPEASAPEAAPINESPPVSSSNEAQEPNIDSASPPHLQNAQETVPSVPPHHVSKWTQSHPQSQIIGEPSAGVRTRATTNFCLFTSYQAVDTASAHRYTGNLK
ncbi:pectinesterase inhibitor 10-like [Cynara cardunculus var. scolymus]|uniref:pectinesterase inhibitor 10-like n=1 Tax=Cynara cardunculus var. scolymus TaxID=59895 RepID=UPI000D624FD9|nr:pectinesterase inhibitor 10-like [Cynara cardunculus var. scolymus]